MSSGNATHPFPTAALPQRMTEIESNTTYPVPSLRVIPRDEHGLFDKLVFSKIRERFGGRVRFFISGAAALNRDMTGATLTLLVPIDQLTGPDLETALVELADDRGFRIHVPRNSSRRGGTVAGEHDRFALIVVLRTTGLTSGSISLNVSFPPNPSRRIPVKSSMSNAWSRSVRAGCSRSTPGW